MPLEWEPAAFASFASFSYVAGDLSPIKGIKRQPWLSDIESDHVRLSDVIPHGYRWLEPSEIAAELKARLSAEAEEACREFDQIYVLLSGGLDSRIVAGTLSELVAQGKLDAPPTAVTWGTEDSRDVVYARYLAEILGFPWVHLPLTEKDHAKNIRLMSDENGVATSPTHLHRMDWFSQFGDDVLVLAGSYGDSLGRSEFSGRIVLELDFLRPKNLFGLMTDDAFATGVDGLEKEFAAIRDRANERPKYAICEMEQQAHYMRGMIAHAMSIIGRSCHLYQMFTSPEVYSFMWSLHPAARTDQVYTELLKQVDLRLARVPWARTNQPLESEPLFRDTNATLSYHRYMDWTVGSLWEELSNLVQPEWFEKTGMFDAERMSEFLTDLLAGELWRYGRKPHETLSWLASIRCLAEAVEAEPEKRIRPAAIAKGARTQYGIDSRTSLRRKLSRLPFAQRTASRLRRSALRKVSLRTYPISNTLSKD